MTPPLTRRQRLRARVASAVSTAATQARARFDAWYSPVQTGSGQPYTNRVGGWTSPFTGQGFGQYDQKVTTDFISMGRIPDQELRALYAFSGIGRRIIDLAVDDATRKGYSLSIENDDEDEAGNTYAFRITDALDSVPVTTSILGPKSGMLHAFNRAEKWARVYGGSLIVLGLDDGREQNQPLDIEALEGIRFMRVLPRTVCLPVEYFGPDDDEVEERPELLGTVKIWNLTPADQGGATTFNTRVHADRVLVFPGFELPSDATDLGGVSTWPTVSMFDVIYNELRGDGITTGTADSLIQKSTLGILTFNDLQNAIMGGAEDKLMSRYRLMNLLQSSLRMTVLDGRAEDFKTVSYDWTGLSSMLDRNPRRVSAVSGYPISLLYGTEEGGLNTGSHEGDRNNYHEGTVRGSIQTDKWDSHRNKMINLQMQVFTNLGEGDVVPYTAKWNPLIALSEKEVAEVLGIQSGTDQRYVQMGALAPSEVRESRFTTPGISLDTNLNPDIQASDMAIAETLAGSPPTAASAGAEDTPPEMNNGG